MMTAEDRKAFEDLRAQVPCEKNFSCISDALDTLCQSKFHPDLDILECLVPAPNTCKFARPFGCTTVCRCPLRKFIAKNFDRWSTENTAVLRK